MKIDHGAEARTLGSLSPEDVSTTNSEKQREKEPSSNREAVRHFQSREAERTYFPKDESRPFQVRKSEPVKHTAAGLWTADQLRAKLRKYDRTPFIDLLALWMECVPSVDVIEYFAERYPDRFIKAMTELGRLAGFADKSQIDVTMTAQVGMLSDSQLEDRLRQAAERLGIEVPKALTVGYERIEEKETISPNDTVPKGTETPP